MMRMLRLSPLDGESSSALDQGCAAYKSPLQQAVDKLSEFRYDDYNEILELTGASPFFNVPVYTLNKSEESHVNEKGQPEQFFCNELSKSIDYSYFFDRETSLNLMDILHKYVGDRPAHLWMSDSLPLDLNLPMTSRPPRSSVQLFLIAQDKPPIVLTVFDQESSVAKDVELFTVEMARLLTWRLLRFCHVDLLLLACTLTWDKCDVAALQSEVVKQMDYSFRYFGGIRELTSQTLITVKNAAVAVADASYVPAFYIGKDDGIWLLLMDPDWRNVLSGVLEMLVRDDSHCSLTYTAQTEFKVKVALLEAARRLSFRDDVIIVTPEEQIHGCIKDVTWQVQEELKLELKLSVQYPPFSHDDASPTSTEYIIGIDCPTDASEQTARETYGWDVLCEAVKLGKWTIVGEMILRGISDTQRKWALKEAAEQAPEDVILDFLLETQEKEETVEPGQVTLPAEANEVAVFVLNTIVRRHFWRAVAKLLTLYKVNDMHRRYAITEARVHADAAAFSQILHYCVDDQVGLVLVEAAMRDLWAVARELIKCGVEYKQPMRVILVASKRASGDHLLFYKRVCRWTVVKAREHKLSNILLYCCDDQLDVVFTYCVEQNLAEPGLDVKELKWKWDRFGEKLNTISPQYRWASDLFLEYLHTLMNCIVVPSLAAQDIMTEFQVHALAEITCTWKSARRFFLSTAVEHSEWNSVKQLVHHSLYDDQRTWLLQQAFSNKRWDIAVLLSDHGLTDDQLMRAHSQVARCADWQTVLQIFERGADVRQIIMELGTTRTDSKRLQQLNELEIIFSRDGSNFSTAVEEAKWSSVLHKVRLGVSPDQISLAMKAALQNNVYHVLTQLVNEEQRNCFFPEVIRRQHWGVPRALLERGVRADLGRAALQELMEVHQWILEARLMELSLDDAERRRVMHAALDEKEESVVTLFIEVMKDRLSAEDREWIFQQCLRQGMWQAVKCLVTEQGMTGLKQRDTACQSAAARGRWDVVRHCIYYGADINLLDDNGETLLHKAAKDGQYQTLLELVHRGADLQDISKVILLHTVIDNAHNMKKMSRDKEADQYRKIAEELVKLNADVNQPDPQGVTPLYQMIGYRQYRLIRCCLLYGHDVSRTVGPGGWTALHVMFWAGDVKSVRTIVARGGDPLTVTGDGQTLLSLAVMSHRHNRKKLVAECIKLGISTHQPLTSHDYYFREFASDITNRFIGLMLYESGAWSNKELHKFQLMISSLELFLYLNSLMATPRTLKSSCRLVISHCLGVHWERKEKKNRQTRADQLPLTPELKRYVLFDDLVNPK